MKKHSWVVLGIGIVIALGLAWYLISPLFISVEVNEESPVVDSDVEIISQANFVASAHEVEGRALIIEDSGEKILRFEDFETVNGPNLHIYLSSDLEGQDYIDLGEIKATKGNVNYDIPDNVDLEKYDKVLVWCVPFEVLFSYADL